MVQGLLGQLNQEHSSKTFKRLGCFNREATAADFHSLRHQKSERLGTAKMYLLTIFLCK